MTQPFKCPDCGLWWSGPVHRCNWEPAATTTTEMPVRFVLRCNCTYNDQGQRIANSVPCPIHEAGAGWAST